METRHTSTGKPIDIRLQKAWPLWILEAVPSSGREGGQLETTLHCTDTTLVLLHRDNDIYHHDVPRARRETKLLLQ